MQTQERNDDTYGSVRINQEEISIEFQNRKLKKQGEITANQREKIMLLQWKDKQDVCLLSTIHSPEIEVTRKKNWKDGNIIILLK